MDELDLVRTSAEHMKRNALDAFLAVTETWEDRPERASRDVLRVSWVTAMAAFLGGLLTLYITSRLRHSDLREFFWIHPIGRLEHALIVGYHAVAIVFVVLGIVGLAIAFVMTTSATGASTRYAVAGEALLVGSAAVGEAFILFFFVLQLILWIVVIGLVMVAAFTLLASLASG